MLTCRDTAVAQLQLDQDANSILEQCRSRLETDNVELQYANKELEGNNKILLKEKLDVTKVVSFTLLLLQMKTLHACHPIQ